MQLVVGAGQPAAGSWTPLELDPTGKATYTPTWTTNPGGRKLWVRGTAYDASGNVQSEQKSVSIYDPDVNLPVINLNSIGSTPITDRVAIVGSIMPNGAGSLSSWKLQYLQAAAIDGADPRLCRLGLKPSIAKAFRLGPLYEPSTTTRDVCSLLPILT